MQILFFGMALRLQGIDDMCLKYFVEAGALAVRRVSKKDIRRIAKATGGRASFWEYQHKQIAPCLLSREQVATPYGHRAGQRKYNRRECIFCELQCPFVCRHGLLDFSHIGRR